MKKFYILLFTFLCLNSSFAQKNIEDNPSLGFACYGEGSQTKAVGKFTKLIEDHKYEAIKKLLYSKKGEQKFLAVVTVEKLDNLGKIILSEKDKQKITEIRNSNQLVSVCAGCTYFNTLTLKQTFEVMESSAQIWLSNFF